MPRSSINPIPAWRKCPCMRSHPLLMYPTKAAITMGSPSKPTPPPREEEIGMQERPLETTYYDLLGVPVDATTDEIKNAYRASICYPFILSRLIAQSHPPLVCRLPHDQVRLPPRQEFAPLSECRRTSSNNFDRVPDAFRPPTPSQVQRIWARGERSRGWLRRPR
jgi:hypothetical protein